MFARFIAAAAALALIVVYGTAAQAQTVVRSLPGGNRPELGAGFGSYGGDINPAALPAGFARRNDRLPGEQAELLEWRFRLAEQRRQTEKDRREKSRASIRARIWNEDQLAASRFKVAHMLYRAGMIDGSKRVLGKLIEEYPDTSTANRAMLTLAKF